MRRALMVLAVSFLGVVGTVAPAAASTIAVLTWDVTCSQVSDGLCVSQGSFGSDLTLYSNVDMLVDAKLTLPGKTESASKLGVDEVLAVSDMVNELGGSATAEFVYQGDFYSGALGFDEMSAWVERPDGFLTRSAQLQFEVVPEPSTLLLCASGALIVLRRRRRQ